MNPVPSQSETGTRLELLSGEEIAEEIAERLVTFKADLIAIDPLRMMRKWLLHGVCFALTAAKYYDVKQAVADALEIHSTAVFMVGSGKLGFSISPQKRYRPFGDESDFDMAIVSEALYQSLWLELFTYFERTAIEDKGTQKYHFRGWLRPDLFPEDASLQRCNRLRESVQHLNSTGVAGRYPIKVGVYYSWPFLEGYQLRSLESCKEQEGS